jgi:GNAT superfamily N-acetyltransferase
MSAPDWFAAIDGTWPAAEYTRLGALTLRRGQGGGSRVSATTVDGDWNGDDLDRAEVAMRGMGQRCIFQLRPGQDALDAALEARGYRVLDPVTIYACPVDALCDVPIPRVTVLHVWEPLALMREIWAEAGIGPARLAVMARTQGPRTGMLGRWNEKPAGVGFAAIHADVAMVHALEVLAHQRRNGMGGWFMRSAAFWARKAGARWISVMCTDANAPANALYRRLGMPVVGHYHYRIMPEETS